MKKRKSKHYIFNFVKNLILRFNFAIAGAIIIGGIFVIPHIPYVSLITTYSLEFVLWSAIIFGLRFNAESLIKAGLALLVFILLETLFQEKVFAEQLGNTAFLTLSTGVIILFKESFIKS